MHYPQNRIKWGKLCCLISCYYLTNPGFIVLNIAKKVEFIHLIYNLISDYVVIQIIGEMLSGSSSFILF